jgi:hypothetical protein
MAVLFLEQKSNEDQLNVLWKHYLKINARYSEVDGQIQSKIESMVSDGKNIGITYTSRLFHNLYFRHHFLIY